MPTVADIRAASNSLVAVSYPILEPINAPEIFGNKLQRFGENYNTSTQSHLLRYLVALCGDAGAGQLKREMLLPRLEQQLEVTHFNNLDRLYGNPLALPRLNAEVYTYNPGTDILNETQWNEVRSKDASYRARCLLWMRALLEGPTPRGMALAVEAAIGVDADVWERYQYVQNPIGTDFGKTSSTNEFVVIPRTILAPSDTRAISRLLDQLKPVNTIGTIFAGTSPRAQRFSRLADASSNFFHVKKLVTGRPDVTWPDVNVSNGYWIDQNEREAPTYAFMNKQESVIYLTIVSATASSIHQGLFNPQQQDLFAHLRNATPDSVFDASFSYDSTIAPINLSASWTGTPDNNIVINNSYPLGYFVNVDSTFVNANTLNNSFWASVEKSADTASPDNERWSEFTWGDGSVFGEITNRSNTEEWIEYDLGRVRPMNYIHFEICMKPIDWVIQYNNNGTWTDIPMRDDYAVTMSSVYAPSTSNPWMDFDFYFDQIQTQYIRILFYRRDEPLIEHLKYSIPISIDLRGVRLMNTAPVVDDYVDDAGTDILGNQFRTDIVIYSASNSTDNNINTFWQSQPNPSRFAVESLYFDLRQGLVQGTMDYLDTQFMDELDTRSMTDIETFYSNGQLVDEIYIDPITYGPDMHFYYSDDDEGDWDLKLWTPIPRDYILKKGFHALPRPTFIRYFKIEFSNLTAIPYEPVQFPTLPPVTFKRFPLWVNNYFNSFNNVTVQDTIQQTTSITIDPLSFGFVKVADKMVSNYEAIRDLQVTSTEPELIQFVQTILGQSTSADADQADAEAQIQFRSPIMWQSDLIANLDSTRALSRVALLPTNGVFDTGWNSELTLPAIDVPVQASTTDLTQPLQEKTRPTMWFPRRCRHNYQIAKAPLDRKIAYVVGVREVAFYRRNYTAPVDEPIYVETLDDTAHIASNDFVQNDWRYVVA